MNLTLSESFKLELKKLLQLLLTLLNDVFVILYLPMFPTCVTQVKLMNLQISNGCIQRDQLSKQ